ncbi:MAG: L,D-transpeptidase/peptidoglycan binding protein [Lachnospiraceae bacterium]|nr:L,D-transpeptidase/peptidoglycan binding protein [Lachnospiraceae bacterium]
MAGKSSKKKKRSKKPLIILIVVLALIAAGYIFAARYFSDHFYPDTTINGKSYSFKTVEEVKKTITSAEQDYMLAVHDRDGGVRYINGPDIDYTAYIGDSVEKLMEAQNSGLWILNIRKVENQTVEVHTSYDDEKLVETVKNLDIFQTKNITEPKDAYVEYRNNEYVIVPEVEGNKPLLEQVLIDIRAAIAAKASKVVLTDDDYAKPQVRSDDPDLLSKVAVSDKYKAMKITYETPDGSSLVLDGKTILSWITINSDLSITVNEDMCAEYAQQLAYKFNTYSETRSFKTTDSGTIEIGGGDYGWIIDKPAEAEQLALDILAGESITREPCYEQRAFVTGKDDIGNTYAEVNYTAQHMWYYEDGELILDCDVVTGNLNAGNGSPDGVFFIKTVMTDTTLTGEDYESPVKFFMPFAYNVGFHDADWRTEFGGEIYKTSGSHGCVNMPDEQAEQLFNEIAIGTPVIAYYTEEVELTNENCRVANAYSYKAPEED